MRKLALICAIFATQSFAKPLDVELYAKAKQAIALQGITAYISSYHEAKVINNTDQLQEVIVYYTLCVDNKGCNEDHHYKIKINPKSTWHDHFDLVMNPNFAVKGTFNINAYTSISGKYVDKGYQTYKSHSMVTVR